jgi:drug/metabolite transporter (DMT)-like permease
LQHQCTFERLTLKDQQRSPASWENVDIDPSLDYATTLIGALLIGTGFVLQQSAAEQEPDSRFLRVRLLADLLRNPRWLAGIACMVCGQILAAWSIGHLELSVVEPLLTTNLIFALVLAVPLSRHPVTFTEVLGAIVLCGGVALLSATRSAQPIGLSFGSFSNWPTAAGIAVVAGICVHAGLRRQGPVRAGLTGAGAGLIFGIQDALTRQTLEVLQGSSFTVLFTSWSAYALVGAGALGIWLMQSAFNAGPLQYSLPLISACEPLAGILLGVVVFGDRIQVSPGALATEAGGLAALVAGVILVGRSPTLSGLSHLRRLEDASKDETPPDNGDTGQDDGGTPRSEAGRQDKPRADQPPNSQRRSSPTQFLSQQVKPPPQPQRDTPG